MPQSQGEDPHAKAQVDIQSAVSLPGIWLESFPLACQRLKEAVAEIKRLAKADHVAAADGALILMERIWPALEFVGWRSVVISGNAPGDWGV